MLVRRAIVGLVAVGVVAAGTASCTPTGGGTGGTTTTASVTTTTTPPFDPYTARFFAPSKSWNRPVSELGISGSFDGYRRRLFDYAGAGGWNDPPLGVGYDPDTRGQWLVAFRNYSVPIYDAADATETKWVYWTHWGWPFAQRYVCDAVGVAPCGPGQDRIQTPPTLTNHVPARIPWNPAWAPAPGNDRVMAIVDYRTGEAWELFGVDVAAAQCTEAGDATQSGNWVMNDRATPQFVGAPDQMCLAGAQRYPNIWTTTATVSNRGIGINELALVTRAVEVESGVIRHALEMTNFNTMFGPACPGNSPSAPGAGVSCAFFVPPSNRIEHPNSPHSGRCGPNEIVGTDANRARTVPQGMRFRLRISDAEIEQWLDAKGYTGVGRNSVRVFVVAMRDYGFVAGTETGCNQPVIQTDGLVNPATRAIWERLGVVDVGADYDGDGAPDYPSGNILFGTYGQNDGLTLITPERLEVVNPA